MTVAPGGLTVLRCAGRGCTASKRWQWQNGAWQKYGYNAGSWFHATEHAPAGLHELAALLEEVQRDSKAFIVRGRLTDDAKKLTAARKAVLRRKHPKNGIDPTLVETPRQWIMADIDGWHLPEWADLVDDPETVIDAAIRDLLPEPFHDAEAWWQLSSSAGFVPGILKVHVFFWLSEPADNLHIKKVLRQHAPGVDRSPFSAAQPHYIAAPIIEGGHDPLPRRTGWRKGSEQAVTLPEQIAETRERSGRADLSDIATIASPGVEGALALLGDGNELHGFHEPLRLAIMRYAVDSNRHGTRDDDAIKTRLRQAIEEAPADPAKRSDVAVYLSDTYLDASINGAFAFLAASVPPEIGPAHPHYPRPHYPRPHLSGEDAGRRLRRVIRAWLDRVELHLGFWAQTLGIFESV